MIINNFSIARLPRIEFGSGVFSKIAAICCLFGQKVLLVSGHRSFENTIYYSQLKKQFSDNNISWSHLKIEGEPTPQVVDEAVEQFSDEAFEVVLGVGGGSALDAAKAIAGLLKVKQSVMDFLEGVGPELTYEGPSVPFIAVPTTAGTGSEATKNSVLSVQGKDGFKKSFRDDKLVAEYAIVDPDLLATCPKDVVAANGMDALTQLLESYISTRSNTMTDALAISGIKAVCKGLMPMFEAGNETAEARSQMAYGSMLSGVCLAQTGLGSVHGLASPLGAFYPIPHGVVCGTLVAQATDVNIMAMLSRERNNPALDKYAHLGDVLAGKKFNNKHESWERLCGVLTEWTEKMQLPLLSEFGVTEDKLDHVVAHCRGSSMQTNPVVLTDAEIKELLLYRL